MTVDRGNDTPLRLRLRVAAKLMLLIGFLATVTVMLSSFGTDDSVEPVLPALTVDVSDMAVGTSRLINREGRPVIIVRRAITDTATDEPVSEWFVALAMGTDFSCVVNWHTATGSEQPLPTLLSENGLSADDWAGGFRDTCRGSWYDAEGRVLDGQYAKDDLTTFPFELQLSPGAQTVTDADNANTNGSQSGNSDPISSNAGSVQLVLQ